MAVRWALERLQRFRTDTDGAAALEFAVVASAFIIVSMGLFEFGRSLQVRNEMAYAMDWGARVVLMNADVNKDGIVNEDDIRETIEARFDNYSTDQLEIKAPEKSVDCTREGKAGKMKTRSLWVKYPLKTFVPGFTGKFDIILERLVPIGDCV